MRATSGSRGRRSDRLDPTALLLTWHLDPARFPGEVVDRVPGQPGPLCDLGCQRRLARARDSVHKDPGGHRAIVRSGADEFFPDPPSYSLNSLSWTPRE